MLASGRLPKAGSSAALASALRARDPSVKRRYTVHTPTGPLAVEAARAVLEHGCLALYAVPPGAEREMLVAAFGPGGWLRFEADR